MQTYSEHFNDGPGGWYGWDRAAKAVEIRDGCAISRSPWWVDFNHAPPGAGYLHILFALNTRIPGGVEAVAGENRFLQSGFPRDFTNARIRVRLRGSADLKGAQLVLLVQSDITEPIKTRVNSVLTGQPLAITPDWSDQTITCVPDNGQWKGLGSRHNRFATYGWGPIAPVLRDVNCDIIFVLFPLDVAPIPAPGTGTPAPVDIHIARAGKDYTLDTARLPTGEVQFDEVEIAFAGP